MAIAWHAAGAGQACKGTWLAPQCRHNRGACLGRDRERPDTAINPRVSNMAKQTRQELAWTEIDPASLPDIAKIAYDDYKEQYRRMKHCREVFEQHMNEACSPPDGKRVVCGYNFGKLSIALADAAAAPKVQPKGSLADFLAASQASGRRS